MASYSKMVVILESEYLQLTNFMKMSTHDNPSSSSSTHYHHHPYQDQIQQLEKKTLEYDKVADPYRRMRLESENLKERRGINERIKKLMTISTPRQYRSRAENLLDVIEPHLEYNERGELINRDTNEVFQGSHIDDLLQHAIRDVRRKLKQPVGWQYFLRQLMQLNVPKNLLGTPTIAEMDRFRSAVGKAAVRTTAVSVSRSSRKRSIDEVLRQDDDSDDEHLGTLFASPSSTPPKGKRRIATAKRYNLRSDYLKY